MECNAKEDQNFVNRLECCTEIYKMKFNKSKCKHLFLPIYKSNGWGTNGR
jgi:hypothetical protein